MKIQKISINPRDQNLKNFCPFCGVENANEEGEITECPHLLFIYLQICYLQSLYSNNISTVGYLKFRQIPTV